MILTIFWAAFLINDSLTRRIICLYCKVDNVSEIDDEQHLLLRCSRFSEIRIALFDHVRKSCPRIDINDENKFIYLLNSSGSTIQEVAKFLHSAYKNSK